MTLSLFLRSGPLRLDSAPISDAKIRGEYWTLASFQRETEHIVVALAYHFVIDSHGMIGIRFLSSSENIQTDGYEREGQRGRNTRYNDTD